MATNAPINYTPNNTFIFSFVRMNPPTPGHLVLIKAMIDKAIEFGTEKIYVLTSSSMDESSNPLPCNDTTIPNLKPKLKSTDVAYAAILDNLTHMPDLTLTYKSSILTNMIASYKQQLIEAESDLTKKTQIENLQIIVKCASGNTFGFINSIINEGFISKGVLKVNLYFIVGSDRADFLNTILNYFRNNANINSVYGELLGREVAVGNKRKLSDMNLNEMSATQVRDAVHANNFEEFQQLYRPYLDSTQIQNLYNTIKIGLQPKPSSSKDEESSSSKDEADDRDNAVTAIISQTRRSKRTPKINTLGGRKRRITRKNKINKRTTKKNKKIRTRRKSRRYR